jgi:hypothetical protein
LLPIVATIAAVCLAVLSIVPPAARAEGIDYVFNVNCPISHFGSDDPIVSPDLPGNSHRHAFYGNSTTDAFSTTKTLLATRSTCDRGFAAVDHSAYWVPTLYRKLPGKQMQEVHLSPDDQHLAAYYRRSGGTTGRKVEPFPQGLRMIAGDPFAGKPQSTLDVAWRCNPNPEAAYLAEIPNCTGSSELQAIVSFWDCWDGKHLDSPDHRSHMAPSRGPLGTCPKSHPVKLPQLTFELTFRLPAVANATYQLSSGGRYSLHGDFFAAWDDRVQSALVNSCLNAGRYCENPNLSDVDLSAATPVIHLPEPTRASTAAPSASAGHAAHVPAAVPTSAGPATLAPAAALEPDRKQGSMDPGLLGGIGAVMLVALAILYTWVRRRKAGRRIS